MNNQQKSYDTTISADQEENSEAWDLLKYHAQIRSELPGLLARLVQNGKKDDALRLLTGWGTREIKNSQIWIEAKSLLAEERQVNTA
ncbi:MAG: hypothetical protein ACYCVD_02955 [Desulfitobacteriaceae bacterium]